MSETAPANVFISYTHESEEHRERVLALSNRLRNDGIDCRIDRYYEVPMPAEGWPMWMASQIEHADFVLVVCTPTYLQRFRREVPIDSGRGVQWEGAAITQSLYMTSGSSTKFIPIGFGKLATNRPNIPLMLQGANYYDVSTEYDYIRLYRHLTHQPEVIAPDLGQRRVLPPQRPTSGVTDVSRADVTNTSPLTAVTNTPVSPATQLSPAQLRRLLVERTNLSEIGVLWFDLFGTPMTDSLPGRSLSECVIELLTRAAQRGKTQALLDTISAEYPHVLTPPPP